MVEDKNNKFWENKRNKSKLTPLVILKCDFRIYICAYTYHSESLATVSKSCNKHGKKLFFFFFRKLSHISFFPQVQLDRRPPYVGVQGQNPALSPSGPVNENL